MASGKRLSYRWRLFFPIVGMLWFIIFVLVFYQYKREVAYRTESIKVQLSLINNRIIDAYEKDVDMLPFIHFIERYFENSILDEVMVRVYDKDGKLIYSIGDASVDDYSEDALMELREIEADGGVHRLHDDSNSMFYFKPSRSSDGKLYVHTVMPYTVTIADALSAEPDFWIIVALLALGVTIMAYFSMRYLSRNVMLLRSFASKIDEDGDFSQEDKFSHDELGDVARQLVKLYREKDESVARSEKEHRIALHAVEEKSRIKRQLTNNINHELKTPVGVVKGYLDTILSTPDMDDETKERFLLRAQANVERLCNLLNDVSAMTRLEEGAGKIPLEEINFHDLVFTVENDFIASGQDKSMKFDYNLPLDCRVKGNYGLLTGMMNNLIKNATHHSQGTEMGVKLIVESAKYYTFCFYDNGVGVGEEHLPHLFERFYRIDSGRSRKVGGTGLGMPIVKNTIEALGGTISVHNRSAGGLEIIFTLQKWH